MSRRRDERGAIFPMTVAMMGVILLIASLVVDIGSDRLVRRDMQSTADVVALDLVRQLDGSTASSYTGFDATGPSATLFNTAKTESLTRQVGLLARPDTVTVRLAVADDKTKAFVRWAAAGDVPNAVRVYSAGSSAFRFLPSTPRRTNLQRSALAVMGPPTACVSAGATLAEVLPGGLLDVFLGGLIGITRLSAVSPDGLASLDTQLSLLGLAAQLGVGTVDELATVNVSSRAFIAASAVALSNQGKTAAATVMNAIAARLTNTNTLNIGQLLGLDTGKGTATGISINAFSLAQSVIMVSDKNHFITLPASVATGLANIVQEVKVIEAPTNACGPKNTIAHSAQIQLRVHADVTAPLGVSSAKLNPLFVTIADGSAQITGVTCSGGNRTTDVMASSGVAKLGLNLDVGLVGGLTSLHVGVPDPAVKPDGATVGGTSSQALTFTFPEEGEPPGQTAGTQLGHLGLNQISPVKTTVETTVLGLNLSNGEINSVVNPLINSLDDPVGDLLRTTLNALGVGLGTVRVKATGRPSCEPVLSD